MPKIEANDRPGEGTISRRSVLKIGAAAGAAGVMAPSMLTSKEALGFQTIAEPVVCVAPTNSPPHHPFVDDFTAPIVPGAIRVSVAERYDVIIDFGAFNAGDKLYLKENRTMFVGNPSPDPLPPGLNIGNVLMQFNVVNTELTFPPDTPPIPSTLCTYPTLPPTDNTWEWQFVGYGPGVCQQSQYPEAHCLAGSAEVICGTGGRITRSPDPDRAGSQEVRLSPRRHVVVDCSIRSRSCGS